METKRRGRPPKSATPVVDADDSDMEIGAKARQLVKQDNEQKSARNDKIEEFWEVTAKGKLRYCRRLKTGTLYRRYKGNIKHPEVNALYEQLLAKGQVRVTR